MRHSADYLHRTAVVPPVFPVHAGQKAELSEFFGPSANYWPRFRWERL
ncbi:hypothetical protein RB2501_13464 [Robiginitalea biformata HTCC2501]|uniref:Uncharacterized protein n=1 Tax=Robiginitalea biformata (strain ATCC BAA-864 / DSM 15991 / KCTC 12146 / HTCC2501) TaxID=313596 RepID=A4CKE0_ROBBH|nr:hypothetical protein RB2501_13464 [Robiginitalea biformata HTCC2501]